MMDELLRQARGRMLRNQLLSQLALSGACFCGATALLLILGTQILDWWVPLTLAALTFGAGLAWVYRKAPTLERVARTLDHRCGLADTLSTAVCFRDSSLALVEVQRGQAESVARTVHLTSVLPLRTPRALYPMAGLAILAVSLFLFRYGVERELNLRAPISLIRIDPLTLAARAQDPSRQHKSGASEPAPTDLMSRLGTSTPDNPNAQDLDTPAESASTAAGKDAKAGTPAELADGKKESGVTEESSGAESGAGAPKDGADQPPSSRDGAPQGAQAGGKTPGSAEGSSGLMSRLKDAVSSLISKMKPSGGQSSQQASGKQPNGTQQGGQKSSQAGQAGQQGNQAQQQGEESASAESEQMQPGQGSGKSSDQNATAKPGSGMGHQDGSKELKDAEQLAAMGKLSEIIGRRSAQVTGEMTIEPQSGPQQLRTSYTKSTAKHGESGGDVSRDEIPVAMQSYVQQYFEQVRKQAVKTARAGKAESKP